MALLEKQQGMAPQSVVSEDHRVTIPEEIVKELGLTPGKRLRWTIGPEKGEVRVGVRDSRRWGERSR